MDIEEIKKQAEPRLFEALSAIGMDRVFRVEPGEVLVNEIEDSFPHATVEFSITFQFGNVKRKHSVLIGWNDDDGIGLEYGEDSNIEPITYGNLMASLYLDLALDGLDDNYLG